MNGIGTERKPDNWSDNILTAVFDKPNESTTLATWRSGYAADCKSVYAGSIPAVASNPFPHFSGCPWKLVDNVFKHLLHHLELQSVPLREC
jgi:hypothetical protein